MAGRCHDHKSIHFHARYYSLFPFFNSIDENGMYDTPRKFPFTLELLPTAEQEATARLRRATRLPSAKTRLGKRIEAGERTG